MKIKSKVAVPVVFGMVIILAASIFSILKLEFLIWDYHYLVNKEQKRLTLTADIESTFKSQVQAWKNTLLRNDTKYWHEFLAEHDKVQNNLQTLSHYENSAAWANKTLLKHSELLENYKQAFAILKSKASYLEADKHVKGIDRAFTDELLIKRQEIQNEFMSNQSLIEDKQTLVMTIYPLLSFVFAIFTIITMLFFIQKTIILPLKALIAQTIEVSKGKYDLHMDYPYNDEVGHLSKAIAEIKNHIVEAVSNISVVKREVEDAFQAIDNVSHEITKGSDEQLACSQTMENTINGLSEIAARLQILTDKALQSTTLVTKKQIIVVRLWNSLRAVCKNL